MKNLMIIPMLILLAFTAASCKGKSEAAENEHEILGPNAIEMNAAQYKQAGIQLSVPEERSIRGVLKVNGVINVTPQNLATVSAPLGGFVKNTIPVQGSQVVKGEVLATIENMAFIELEQAYLETKARYTYAEIEFKRHNELYKENVYSENNVQLTESEYKTLKSQLKGLEQKLLMIGIDPSALTEDKITGIVPVVAPISGYIIAANVNIGKYVNPTDVMFEIVDPRNIILELTLFEKDIRKVDDGMQVTFTTPDDQGKVYNAVIYQAGKALDKEKTSRAYARITDPGHQAAFRDVCQCTGCNHRQARYCSSGRSRGPVQRDQLYLCVQGEAHGERQGDI